MDRSEHDVQLLHVLHLLNPQKTDAFLMLARQVALSEELSNFHCNFGKHEVERGQISNKKVCYEEADLHKDRMQYK